MINYNHPTTFQAPTIGEQSDILDTSFWNINGHHPLGPNGNTFDYLKQDFHQGHHHIQTQMHPTSPTDQMFNLVGSIPSIPSSLSASPTTSVHANVSGFASLDQSQNDILEGYSDVSGSEGSSEPDNRASKKRKNSDDSMPTEVRKKFLERNRQAASKCRQKKKAWMVELENAYVEREKENRELLAQISKLRNHTLYLRDQLLAHSNCECSVVKNYLQRTAQQILDRATEESVMGQAHTQGMSWHP
ncbi:basic-leucine zipper transcription factor [Phycomyces blakesleeanus]|uniref:Basic-leucine zipper transcription factor n=2 Tax=Phycomyces blakesleeanus TaxID=4837 RepID=A0A162TEJ0_PHYB8|nr:basic-leucine zipper transcription factor [Phycomyces blakesleeanus NRRL 1555(-)]OAD66513.1 basic-leucine zipper transcription factor [Phycomyces blakesleeanus NRRL 1555(-)]|eukprot:XP_018284553.1 basic-leucine zipper transcription factor [Phycomyces blakesleeanus NRRL 1555(-)]